MTKLDMPDLGGYPTLRLYDAANRLVTITERLGGTGAVTHAFTFDNVGRPLSSDYGGGDCTGHDVPDIVRAYDALPGGISCPTGVGCNNLAGRLAWTKVKLMCSTLAGSDGNYTVEQQTFYSYDAAGRVVHEYITDDNGRTADQQYEWTKNGALSKVTLPSTAVIGWTYDSVGSNSDLDHVTAMWRTTTSTPIADAIAYEPYGPLRQYNQQNSVTSKALKTRILHNLAYRVTETRMMTQDESATYQQVTIGEDAAGRVTMRDYEPNAYGLQTYADSYFLYDQQDRVLCETTTLLGTCPSSGSNYKNSHSLAPPFTAAGDLSCAPSS